MNDERELVGLEVSIHRYLKSSNIKIVPLRIITKEGLQFLGKPKFNLRGGLNQIWNIFKNYYDMFYSREYIYEKTTIWEFNVKKGKFEKVKR